MVYFLKNKGHVIENFKEFRELIEKQCGFILRCLRLDHGEEYVNNGFERYLSQNGIFLQRYKPYTLQNDVTERKNQSLIEMACCLLRDKGLLTQFWVEVVHF